MAVITPVGSNFDWSPKSEKLTKTASTGAKAPTDKDLLYEAAKKAVKAQMMDLGNDIPSNEMDGAPSPCEGAPCDSIEAPGAVPGEIVKDVSEEAPMGDESPADEAKEGEAVQDVQKAVQDLVDKANKAEEVAVKVQDAVTKVEEAVNEVKDAVGGGEIVDEVEIEIEDEDNGKNPFEKGEKDEEDEKDEDEEGEKDEIVKESKDKDDKPEMKSAASGNDMVKLSSLSKSVKQKVYDYYKNELGYPADYCKLLVQDN